MAITARKITTAIDITGSSQQAITDSILGKIHQIIISSSVPDQQIDFVLQNHSGLEIYREEGLLIRSGEGNSLSKADLMPEILPMGPVTILLNNPLIVSGTVTVVFIEKERGS